MMTVARMTWKEILRKRVLLVTVVLTAVFLGLFIFGASQAADVLPIGSGLAQKYVRSLLLLSAGLFFANFVVAYLVVFSSIGTISGELETGVLQTVLTRPIPRWQVYLGKWLGYTLWGVTYAALIFWSLVGIVHWKLGFPMSGATLWRAFGLFELIPVVLTALSLLGSSYLPTLGNGVLMVLLFGMGMLGGLLEQILSSKGMAGVGLVTSLFIPTDALYRRLVFELTGGTDLPGGVFMLGPFGSSSVANNAFLWYTGAYIAALLLWGCVHFSRRDV
ncbi:MAG: ABC transporter permease subunit [Alicyclobacillaceae bacterium]|nr:ABC transporter permease subunit [Alicyclobacillaceae bacterium]